MRLQFQPFFRLGVDIRLGTLAHFVVGLGLITLEAHRLSYSGYGSDLPRADWDFYIDTPLGTLGFSWEEGKAEGN